MKSKERKESGYFSIPWTNLTKRLDAYTWLPRSNPWNGASTLTCGSFMGSDPSINTPLYSYPLFLSLHSFTTHTSSSFSLFYTLQFLVSFLQLSKSSNNANNTINNINVWWRRNSKHKLIQHSCFSQTKPPRIAWPSSFTLFYLPNHS